MDTTVFDERNLVKQFQEDNIQRFQKFVKDYDAYMSPILRAQGYQLKNTVSRTVLFTFGEVEFFRNRWYKNGQCKIPVDEKLGLKKHERFSRELLYQAAHLSTYLPYRKVGDVLELVNQTVVSKDTVLKAVKKGKKLLEAKEDYDYYHETQNSSIQNATTIYVEGDGVMVKTTDSQEDNWNTDLAHFVVHTGSEQVGPQRFRLQQKKEFISIKNSKAREKLLDYLYYNFEITEQTQLICNSDGGHGYTYYIFNELAQALGIRHVEYFWDSYHLYEKIHQYFSPYPSEVEELAIKAVKQHHRKELVTAFDTVESLIEDDQELEKLLHFKHQLLARFAYTKPAKFRGVPHQGIGIIESQHRKITYRMKHRGMYWSLEGADTMSQIIILREEGSLRELFMGGWQHTYQKLTKQYSSAHEWIAYNPEHQGFWRPKEKLKIKRVIKRMRLKR